MFLFKHIPVNIIETFLFIPILVNKQQFPYGSGAILYLTHLSSLIFDATKPFKKGCRSTKKQFIIAPYLVWEGHHCAFRITHTITLVTIIRD